MRDQHCDRLFNFGMRMIQEGCLPVIKSSLDNVEEGVSPEIHSQFLYKVLQEKFPLEAFFKEMSKAKKTKQSILPWVHCSLSQKVPCSLSLEVISPHRINAFKFLFELVSQWLVPGKQLNVALVYGVDFYFPSIKNQLYTFCKIIVDSDIREDLTIIQNNIPFLKTEIKLGLQSSYYARRILESKGLSQEEKTARLQEYIALLTKRFPGAFDLDLISEMQHYMVIWKDKFKEVRQVRHLVRIICLHYMYRKWIREAIQAFRGKRYLSLKINRVWLKSADKRRKVLSITVGVNLFKEKEVFQKRHLLAAIHACLPDATYVEDSFFSNYTGNEGICTLYLEVEKNHGEFTEQELVLLRRELPGDLKDRIEYPIHPVFMPRNDEEIMRNILALSHQVKFVRDIPQVVISFEEQTGEHLFFTLILVRVLKAKDKPLQEVLSNSASQIHFIHERSKNIGLIRKKYVKEAQVFRLRLSKEKYLRKDHSIDLLMARQYILGEIVRIIGDVRDFNGGMIDKQSELLEELRELLGSELKYRDLLLDKFFCSLLPIGIKATINPQVIKKLFLMLVESIEMTLLNSRGYHFTGMQDPDYVYVMIKEERHCIKEHYLGILAKQGISTAHIISSHILEQGISYSGYIYPCNDEASQKQFLQVFHQLLQEAYTPVN